MDCKKKGCWKSIWKLGGFVQKKLPKYLVVLKTYASGTITILETMSSYTPGRTCVSGNGIFHRLFWTFNHASKVLYSANLFFKLMEHDFTKNTRAHYLWQWHKTATVTSFRLHSLWLKVRLLVVGVSSLRNLRVHVAPQTNLYLISDRHASIESAYNNSENGWYNHPSIHSYCIRHVTQNFMREIKNKNLREKIMNAGYALIQPSFGYYREEIRLSNAHALRWVDSIPLEKWTIAFDEGRRWSHMTTNLVESMNGVFKGIKDLQIIASVWATYFRLWSLFATRAKNDIWCYSRAIIQWKLHESDEGGNSQC